MRRYSLYLPKIPPNPTTVSICLCSCRGCCRYFYRRNCRNHCSMFVVVSVSYIVYVVYLLILLLFSCCRGGCCFRCSVIVVITVSGVVVVAVFDVIYAAYLPLFLLFSDCRGCCCFRYCCCRVSASVVVVFLSLTLL